MRKKKQVAAIIAVSKFVKRKEVSTKIGWMDSRIGWMNGKRG